ncbi:MAG: DUF4412 domain-containing protein [Gemmatimonadota bacterium]|nr:DUF4412 domain-containing protein [Gemmatimonadota bacterium]MDH3366984.1 DUF4412 domain-containing protein [Gemmatimonadota bacterium]MDH3476738.1 DUF4412 domain-containing protein [Gemmatimonadota bacterium]MDH3569933.1 DUF4412 domain-containing protein [Gemmatimonadota bacterium]MDH5551103.1 DUF4412 domain-containing protein [Gemmatimonadota bacterium]
MGNLFAIACLVLPVLTTFAVPAAHAQEFEGTVTMREIAVEAEPLIERMGGDRERLFALSVERLLEEAQEAGIDVADYAVTYYMKGSMLRSTTSAMPGEGESYVLVDYAKGIYRLVQPEQRLYVEWTADSADVPPVELDDETVSEESEARIEPIGETRIINGIRCTGYRSTDETGTVAVAWLTADLEDLKASFTRLAELSESMGDEEGNAPVDRMLQYGFPVLTMALEGDWEPEFSVAQLVSVERTPLSDDLFEPPAGFMKISMREMMRRQIERP